MKKILFLSLLLMLPVSLVLAVGGSQGTGISNQVQQGSASQNQEQVQNQGTDSQIQTQTQQNEEEGVQNQEQTQTQNQGESVQVQVQNQNQQGDSVKAQNATQLKSVIQSKKQELAEEVQEIKDAAVQKVYQNQNAVREAVYSLLAAEDLVGGIGQQISEIAQNFNNSADKTIQAEEKIQSRSIVARLFLGGDKEAGAELEEEVNRNRERIQTLNQLMDNCNCQEETKSVLQEQIQNMEQEQDRLEKLAQEQQSNGIFGWLVQLFK